MKLKQFLQQALIFILFILLWKLIVYLFKLPNFILPTPERVFSELVSLLQSGLLLKHAFITLKEIIVGFIIGSILGFIPGYIIAKSETLERILFPYIIAAQTAPTIALAPLIMIWLGFGFSSKVTLVILIVFFPMLVNTIVGIRSIDRNLLNLVKSLKATKYQIFSKLEIPYSLPILFAGLKTSMTLAVVGAVVSEFVGASAGLGYLTIYSTELMNTVRVFVAVATLTILGILLYELVCLIERLVMPWYRVEKKWGKY